MPFHRFDRLARTVANPRLAKDAAGATLEGRYTYFRRIYMAAGTGSELHYHPNELIIFPLQGRMNAVVGKDRRIVTPGTFVHVPANAQHSIRATEDGPMNYLYIKDKTWSLVGIAAAEAPPDKDAATRRRGKSVKSRAIVDGLGVCYYPLTDRLDAPAPSAQHATWLAGERLEFGFVEALAGAVETRTASPHEQFLYMLWGGMRVTVDSKRKHVGAGDIIEIPRGARYELAVPKGEWARYVGIRSTRFLEGQLKRRG